MGDFGGGQNFYILSWLKTNFLEHLSEFGKKQILYHVI
jgi:hypothetical protein